jgi:hypothetical protein
MSSLYRKVPFIELLCSRKTTHIVHGYFISGIIFPEDASEYRIQLHGHEMFMTSAKLLHVLLLLLLYIYFTALPPGILAFSKLSVDEFLLLP